MQLQEFVGVPLQGQLSATAPCGQCCLCPAGHCPWPGWQAGGGCCAALGRESPRSSHQRCSPGHQTLLESSREHFYSSPPRGKLLPAQVANLPVSFSVHFPRPAPLHSLTLSRRVPYSYGSEHLRTQPLVMLWALL